MIELSITDKSATGGACACGGMCGGHGAEQSHDASGCACGGHGACDHGAHDHGASHSHGAHAHGAAEGVVLTRLAVDGMTCGHCVSAVTEELVGLAGVSGVDVELAPGATSIVTVRSDLPLQDEVVRSAIAEAGYSLV